MINEIKKQIRIKSAIGWVVGLVLLYWIILSFLSGVYYYIPLNDKLSNLLVVSYGYLTPNFSTPIDTLVVPINFNQALSRQNIPLAIAYALLLVCWRVLDSARAQSRELKDAYSRYNERRLDKALDGESPQEAGPSGAKRAIEIYLVESERIRKEEFKKNFFWKFIVPLLVGVISGVIVGLVIEMFVK